MTAVRRFLACLLLASCQTPGGDVRGLSDLAPLDYAVLVTGGAFLQKVAPSGQAAVPATFAGADDEPIPIEAILAVLREAAVFRRVDGDPDPEQRRALLETLREDSAASDPALREFLQHTRDQGYDWLLVVERLQDGAVEAQGINGRWPITLSFWFLFGIGFLIPDHTFESRATLRITVRDLQTGRTVHDPLLDAGPVDLSLVERGNFLGIVLSIIVPPFWVHDDTENVAAGVREVTQRRLLVSLAGNLKSESTRQRLRERSVAVLEVVRSEGRNWLSIDAAESLSQVRLRQGAGAVEGEAMAAFQAALLGSLQLDGGRFRYRAPLEVPLAPGPFQVLVSTIAGNATSATLNVGGGP